MSDANYRFDSDLEYEFLVMTTRVLKAGTTAPAGFDVYYDYSSRSNILSVGIYKNGTTENKETGQLFSVGDKLCNFAGFLSTDEGIAKAIEAMQELLNIYKEETKNG